jgi:N-acetylglucosaminyldiphosphoundecaprenol N-acetyl-beta-D-mannosaminyltransferase
MNTKISLQKMPQMFKHCDYVKQQYSGTFIDRPVAILLMLLLLPCFIINVTLALMSQRSLFSIQYKTDAFNRKIVLHHFTCGIFVKTAVLLDVFFGRISLCGVPLTHRLTPDEQLCVMKQIRCRAGIFSLYDLHVKTGLTVMTKEKLLEQQLNGSFADYTALMIKSFMAILFYGRTIAPLNQTKYLSLFGLKINNTSMAEAVNWIIKPKCQTNKAQIIFFINAYSINLSISKPSFFKQLLKADTLFAEGSGMRLAARKAGSLLKGNNNGTDMLPYLCKSCIKNSQSLYFLGAKPGIAKKAAEVLCEQFPELNIVGTEHGYNDASSTKQIIKKINNSACDVLLVAMGSPLQEEWLLEHEAQLNCKSALAVGGLFDFYSNKISRSPMWLREIGLEWIWRLLQEPSSKFYRYVIGNPLFLYRTFLLDLVNKGEK